MITTKFEDTYSCVNAAKADIEKLAAVVDFLRAQTAPITCREIGMAIFGNDYIQGYHKRSLSCRMGQMLHHLHKGGFIKVEEVKGEPMEIEVEEYVRKDDKGNRPKLLVHDDEGNSYIIDNPNYRYGRSYGNWEKVKKTITPTYKVYSWVAE